MQERMYNVVRFSKDMNKSKKCDYHLTKNDVIKMGRVKLKVASIHNKKEDRLIKKRIKRRKERVSEAIKG